MSEEEDDAPVKKKVSGKRLILIVGLVVLLLGGGAAGVMMSGLLDSIFGSEEVAEEEVVEEEVPVVEAPGTFYELEEMTVSLSNTGSRKSFLVLGIQLELTNAADVAILDQNRPKIVSEFNLFLRELRAEELNGSEGAYLVSEELFRRVTQVVPQVEIKNLLLGKMLVQ